MCAGCKTRLESRTLPKGLKPYCICSLICQATDGYEGCVIEQPQHGSGLVVFAPEPFADLNDMLASVDFSLTEEALAACDTAGTKMSWVNRIVIPAHPLGDDGEGLLAASMKRQDNDPWAKFGPMQVPVRFDVARRDSVLKALRVRGFNAQVLFPRTAARFFGPEATGQRYSWFSYKAGLLQVHNSEMDSKKRGFRPNDCPVKEAPPIFALRKDFATAHELFEAVEQAWPASDPRDPTLRVRVPHYWQTTRAAMSGVARLRTRHMRRKIEHLLRACAQHGDGCQHRTPLKDAQVVSVERVENYKLWDRYSAFRGEAARKKCAGAPASAARPWGSELSRPIKCAVAEDERFLFHGTSPEAAMAILKDGFQLPSSRGRGRCVTSSAMPAVLQ